MSSTLLSVCERQFETSNVLDVEAQDHVIQWAFTSSKIILWDLNFV